MKHQSFYEEPAGHATSGLDGGSWTKTGSSVVTSSTTLTPAISNVNVAVPIRFEIRNVTVSTTARVNFDDFQISGF